MRRMFRVFAVTVFAFAAGCNGGEAPPPATSGPSAPAQDAGQATPAAPVAADNLACNIESVDGRKFDTESLAVVADAPRRVNGWVIDLKNRNVPGDAELALVADDGHTVGSQKIQMWRTRNDVVSAKGGEPGYADSGFGVDLDLSGVAPGRYALVVRSAQAGPATCDVQRFIQVGSVP